MKKILLRKFVAFLIFLFTFGLFLKTMPALARENVTDWYIQNFDSQITVNKDSSLDITEKITADCGNVPGKHGIFRILPEDIKVEGKTIKTPVELLNITDFSGHSIKYTESRNRLDDTVTWKMGDPNETVTGVNYYMIRYRVKSAIRFGNPDFDELYWNLTGNFWELEIDNFHASIVFPAEVSKSNSQVEYYTGNLGEKSKNLAAFQWSAPNVLEFNSAGTLAKGQGITVSTTFPKNIFTPYQPGFWESYGQYFYLLIPIIVLFVCLRLWRKYGDDPELDKTVIPEYDIPGNLSPIETGMLMTNGIFNKNLITAEIINLATKGLITIKQLDEKIFIFHSRDYELSKKPEAQPGYVMNIPQKAIYDKIFEMGDSVKLSGLKNKFYTALKDIENGTIKILEDKELIVASGLKFRIAFIIIGIILIFLSFFLAPLSGYLIAGVLLSGLIIFIFSFIMPKRTMAGADLNWKIKGLKLFMETVDKDRAKFYEEENIFEKYLPYAIVFGITNLWINKMKEIYGADYYATHAPIWYAGSVGAFDADSFSSAVDSLSSSIAANTSSPSGSGGSGGSGGGGGGGGGGGW